MTPAAGTAITMDLAGNIISSPPKPIPLWIKILYTAFVAVLVPYYWSTYGPRNFLYFCDVALLLTLAGIWLESSLLISMQAIAILLPQMIWVLDFAAHFAGLKFLGMTDYMFNPQYKVFVRALSLFHGWLPFFLLWLLSRVGYNRRAFPAQMVVGISLLMICYFAFISPTPNAQGWRYANINYVFGMDENNAQTKMPPLAWLGVLLVVIPVAMYWPTHLLLNKLFPKAPAAISS